LQKLYSQSCERNTAPILQVLESTLQHRTRILEVGSGTGQHAVAFAQQLPEITWQASDRAGCLDSIRAWQQDSGLAEITPAPLELDLLQQSGWPQSRYDMVFAVNVIHIAPWSATAELFALSDRVLEQDGLVFLYGPFRFPDRDLEASNEAFDQHLRQNNSESGIRRFEEIESCAANNGFGLEGQQPMPANNHCLWWARI